MPETNGGLDIIESEDQRDVRALVREVIAAGASEERIADYDKREAFDEELYGSLAEVGLLQLEATGDGEAEHATYRSQTTVLEELGASATSMAVCLVVQYMGVSLLTSYGSEAQKSETLARLFDGSERVAFCLTEPDGGTDVARVMRTRAVAQPDGTFTLSGSKIWISGANLAGTLMVLARTEEKSGSNVDGITMFLVPRDLLGIDVKVMDTMAIHSLETCEIYFDNVIVPKDAVLGTVGDGFRQVIATLNGERLNAAAVALGMARGALDAAIAFAHDRTAFGRSIGGFQALQHKLVDSVVKVESARGLLSRAVDAVDSGGGDGASLSALAKIASSDAASFCSDVGMRVMGGSGFSLEYPMQRFFRDARLYTFAPFTDEMVRNFVGEKLLGFPRSY